MKKTFYTLLFLSAILIAIPSTTLATSNLPKTVSIGDAYVYDAGSIAQVLLTESNRPIGRQINLEYGVAKTVKSEGFTFFEIITTESRDISGSPDISNIPVAIPNILTGDSTSTYVVYTKFFEKNNPENESFFFSKEFSIITNDIPFIQIKNINFLQSNGSRFDTLHGPTIYNPKDIGGDKTLATSTSIEVTFESNQNTVIKPSVSFSKIRSGSFKQDITLEPIAITKGKTYVVLHLPTFDYQPGVYMGMLSFTGDFIKNKVDFQYIVAGDSVSIGDVSVMKKDNKDFFNFQIFGTPIDMDRLIATTSGTTSEPSLYKVTTDFMDSKGNTVYSTIQDVDFSGADFSIEIPKKYTDVQSLHLSVSSLSGVVVYDATKDVAYTKVSPIKNATVAYIILYILLMLLTVFAIFKKHVKTAIFFIIVLIGLFASRQAFADLFSLTPYKVRSASAVFTFQNIGQVPGMFTQDDIPNTVYTCGESIPFVFKIYYLRCTNSAPYIKAGFSWISFADANLHSVTVTNNVAKNIYVGNYSGHEFYRSYSSFVYKNIPPSVSPTSNLYISVKHRPDAADTGGRNVDGYVQYKIPVQNTCTPSSTVCNCSGRTQVCYQGGTAVSSTTNSTSCALKASCGYTVTGGKAVFNTIVVNALGKITYKDANTGKTIGNPYSKTFTGSSTISHSTTVIDAFDGSTATAFCSAGIPPAPTSTTDSSATGTPTIIDFNAALPVVTRGRDCVYNWNVANVDRCAMVINGKSVPIQGAGFTGPLSMSTTDGLNQRAILTCVKDAVAPASNTTLSTSTLCQVVPQIIER